ncbi:MAG TPA: S8 family serine peptidase, partial [Acidimicrobiales bacterium]|nr:S8 family serine peptidase [Acidimicrobiales bacterium]
MVSARRLAIPLMVVALLAFGPAARGSNDPAFSQQWALSQIGAAAAWGTSTGAGVTIGIVDTGVDLSHEDLAGRVVAHTDCVGSGGDPGRCAGSGQDPHGHGTHVAGVAAAVKDNRRGVAGVAPDARLVVARVLGPDGSGKTSDATAGIKWVVDHGARVVNLSFGDEGLVALSGTSLREGVDYAWSHGAVPVLAAGNTNLLGLGLVGGGDYRGLKAVVVGATTRSGTVAGYSSPLRNAAWSVVAPGGSGGPSPELGVVSTWRANQYA